MEDGRMGVALGAEARERADQYRALASFFLDLPQKEALAGMAEALSDFTEGAEGEESVGMGELRSFFADASVDDRLLDTIGADRTFLVRGVTKKGPRPPYASLYADQASGSSMFSLKATYRQAGFDLSADAHEAPDYLGIELAFCAMLLDRVAQACESGEDETAVAALVGGADDFVAKRVLPLGCGYADEAIPYAKTGYCRGMLHLLKEFLETEEMLVKDEEAAVSAA